MKHDYRAAFCFLLALCVALLLRLPLSAQTQSPVIPNAPPLSALRLNPQQLKASLDAGNVAEAVQQLEQGWRQQLNEYYGRYFRTELFPPEQIAQGLRQTASTTGQRSALIYAVSIPEQLEIILLLPSGQLRHHRVTEASAEVLTTTTRNLRMGLVNINTSTSEYLPPAQQLYRWIIEPLKPVLEEQGITNLIFCLGGKLRSVPMAALHDGQQFLIEQYSIGIIPAFNLLDRRPSQLSEAQVLAMGASEFQNQEPLPAVPVELAAIRQLWPGEVRLNQQFTVENLRQQRSRQPFSLIHLATHADFAPGSVQNSYIQFWDRRLWLDQLRDMNLQAPPVELLVLSACRTALGDTNAELGFAGLAVQSGAKAALASLWKVSDSGTVALMTGFYQNLKTAPTKGEALRQTQLALLQGRLNLDNPVIQQVLRNVPHPSEVVDMATTRLSHPYYWSGFTMIGNPW
ncbi:MULTISPECIES: CHAT domain-containing protein [unclassified Leptolyngbya]|nr:MULTISPECIES: CHAT domain-containing protein [unclassified Leptolyngbya]MBD2158193.1 CHAT domain-containing protein [Leptolyngbya sp. FACHB-16]